jgi:hypothetical protein
LTVNELKEELDKLIENGKGDIEILASKDAEGNGFNSLDEITVEEDLDDKVVIWTI